MHSIIVTHSKQLPVIIETDREREREGARGREREITGSLNRQKQWSRSDTEIGEAPSHYQLMCSNSPTDSKENFSIQFNFHHKHYHYHYPAVLQRTAPLQIRKLVQRSFQNLNSVTQNGGSITNLQITYLQFLIVYSRASKPRRPSLSFLLLTQSPAF
jgi:hypothetical protein